MEGKIPGHEALMRAARAITGASLGLLSDDEKAKLGAELWLQIAARRDDFIPDRARREVVGEVIKAATTLDEHLEDMYLVDFVLSNIRMEGLIEILSGLSEPWVIYTCGLPECRHPHVATRELFNRLTQRTRETLPSSVLGMLTGLLGSRLAIPRLQIIWEPPVPELPEEEGVEDRWSGEAAQHEDDVIADEEEGTAEDQPDGGSDAVRHEEDN